MPRTVREMTSSLPKETQKNGDTNKSKRTNKTNKHAKHKPRLNMQKKVTRPNRAEWTGPGSCAHGNLPMYVQPKCQGRLQLLSPPFLMTSTTKQMRPNGRGGQCVLGEDDFFGWNIYARHLLVFLYVAGIILNPHSDWDRSQGDVTWERLKLHRAYIWPRSVWTNVYLHPVSTENQ